MRDTSFTVLLLRELRRRLSHYHKEQQDVTHSARPRYERYNCLHVIIKQKLRICGMYTHGVSGNSLYGCVIWGGTRQAEHKISLRHFLRVANGRAKS